MPWPGDDMPAARSTTLAVLAGGRGTRMGRPKSHLTLHNTPILERLHRQFAWPGPTLLVTTPGLEHPPAHELFTAEVADPVADQGPLRGLLTALENCSSPLVIVTTVDMPNVGAAQLNHLIAAIEAHPGALGLMLERMTAASKQLEPFPSIYRPAAKRTIAAHLASGHGSLHSLATLAGVVTVTAPTTWPEETWTNLNYREDLEAFLRQQPAEGTDA